MQKRFTGRFINRGAKVFKMEEGMDALLMGMTERAVYLFILTQAEAKIHREGSKGDETAKVFQVVREKVYEAIHTIGNPLPENLPLLGEE